MPKYITIIGHTLMQPICTLSEKIVSLPIKEGKTISDHPDERGFATSICLLLAVMTESFIMRARYLNKENSASTERNITRFIKATYPDFEKSDELAEIFVLRDTIAHNHLWQIESVGDINIWTDLLKKELNPLTEQWTDKKYDLFVDTSNGKTKKLKLHIVPTQIDRTDVAQVLKTVTEILLYIDESENHTLGFKNNFVVFRKDYIYFFDAVKLIMQVLKSSQSGYTD